MIIWPAMVPTAELDTPDASREIKKTVAAPAPSRGRKFVGCLELGDVPVAFVKSTRRHDHHSHIHDFSERERDNDFPVGVAQELAPVGIVMHRQADLGEAGMEVNGVRHDGGANDADGDGDCRRIFELWNDRVKCRRRPIHRYDEQFNQITETDDAAKAPIISSIGRKPRLSNVKIP